jgi:hypothetical protein
MKYKKGESGNPAGRKKGKPNRTTDQIRAMLHDFINTNIETLQTDFESMEPEKRLSFFERLLKHILPAPLQELERLSDEQLDELINRLKKNNS